MTRDISSISLNHLLITDVASIDFKSILDDYRACFAGHRVRINTNYKLLASFDIVFSERDVPHLMGWEKLIDRNVNAGNIIKMVDGLKLTAKGAKKNPEWFQVKKRMLNYNFMHRIFLDQDVKTFVVTRDMHPNRLQLDVVFMISRKNESVIFGLRKSRNRDFFVPTTLHTESSDNPYSHRRLTRIDAVSWID